MTAPAVTLAAGATSSAAPIESNEQTPTPYPKREPDPGVWQPNATKDGWVKTTEEGTSVIDAKAFAQWEKNTQRGLDGKDRFRGVKQKARLDMYVTETAPLPGQLVPAASADATGTP